MASTNRFPSQYNLKTLNIINYRGVAIDIKNALVELDIQMDIFNTCLYGTLIVKEQVDFQQNVPLIGQERLLLEFSTDAEAGYFRKEFYLYQETEKQPYGDKGFIYKIPFCSIEFIKNQEILIQDGFVNAKPETIIEKILSKLTTKPLIIDPTSNTLSYVSPSIHPFEVINYLLPRSNSKQYDGSGYVFYEDANGYNFRTIESFYNQPALTYNFSNKNFVSADFNNEFYTITAWNVVQQYNVLDNMTKGMYGSTVIDINPYTREYNKRTFDYFNDFKNIKHLDDNVNSLHTNSFAFKDSFTGHRLSYPSYDNQQKSKNMAVRYHQLNAISNGLKLIVEVAGNTEINVGKLINLNYPNFSKNKDQPHDMFMKGNYLVTAVRHIINGSEYKTVMELAKDTYYEAHERHNRIGMLL